MGTIKTTNIQSISGSGTVTLGVSGETFNVPSGVTISNSGTATGFGGANTPAFLATNGSTDQSISDQTVTKVNFGSEVYDTDSAFSSSKFTVPSGANGKYMIYASVTYENTTGDVKSDSVRFYKNGSSVLSMEFNGNGNANGPFINTGFRPAIIWYKDRTAGGYWNIRDSKRTPINGTAQELYTAESDVENHHNNRNIDFLSNGFKIRNAHDAINNSSRQYLYMAWAEAPQFNLYGGQSNAR